MSYTLLTNSVCNFTSNATFRNWGLQISNLWGNAGMTKVSLSDTIDWTTVAVPAATYTAAGYEIWKFADALQNTAPVYLTFLYGTASVTNTPALWWRISSGYYGNTTVLPGNTPTGFLGQYGTIARVEQGAQFANTTLRTYFCGDTNRFILAWNVIGTGSASNYRNMLSIERTKDANGVDTSDGVLATWANAGSWGQFYWSPVIGMPGGMTIYETTPGIINPQQGGGTRGANTSVYPNFHNKGGGAFLNPGMNFLGYYHPDFTANTSTNVSIYGAAHTYMPMGNTALYGQVSRANNSFCYMMRWE